MWENFFFNIAISFNCCRNIFLFFRLSYQSIKKAPAVNEALCQELYRYVITPCFKLRENYNNDLAKDYEIREEIINSIQKNFSCIYNSS